MGNLAKIKFRGEEAFITDTPPDNSLAFYGIRHSETDWDDPITIEPTVIVNRWGVIGFYKPLDRYLFDGDMCIPLWEEEKNTFREAMALLIRRKGGEK